MIAFFFSSFTNEQTTNNGNKAKVIWFLVIKLYGIEIVNHHTAKITKEQITCKQYTTTITTKNNRKNQIFAQKKKRIKEKIK